MEALTKDLWVFIETTYPQSDIVSILRNKKSLISIRYQKQALKLLC